MSTPKRRRISTTPSSPTLITNSSVSCVSPDSDDEDSTDTKLALLLSLHPTIELPTLLETLLSANGSVSQASQLLTPSKSQQCKPQTFQSLASKLYDPSPTSSRRQTSLATFIKTTSTTTPESTLRGPRKGHTLHLYDQASVSLHTPATFLPSFLPSGLATSLLTELLAESETFQPPRTFTLFEREVTSPNTSDLFLRDSSRAGDKTHVYQSRIQTARKFTPSMEAVTNAVEEAVNTLIATLPRKWGMSSKPWSTNAALVNRYTGPRQSLGWHADDPTYIGPMAAIASISLGVEREFRVRRAYGKDGRDGEDGTEPSEKDTRKEEGKDGAKGTEGEGQYAIHVSHNSLLIMHPGMQEAWKHCIHPAKRVDVHPVSGETRINITYRCFRESLVPEFTPRCKCKVAGDSDKRVTMILRTVFGKKFEEGEDEGEQRYFWGCGGVYQGDGKGCGAFQWAKFDAEGEPIWDVEHQATIARRYEVKDLIKEQDVITNVKAKKED